MIKLYHCPNARSMRSLWLLNELKLEFELVEMPFEQTHLRSPEYLSIHPLGRVPCLIDGSIKLFESGAMALDGPTIVDQTVTVPIEQMVARIARKNQMILGD